MQLSKEHYERKDDDNAHLYDISFLFKPFLFPPIFLLSGIIGSLTNLYYDGFLHQENALYFCYFQAFTWKSNILNEYKIFNILFKKALGEIKFIFQNFYIFSNYLIFYSQLLKCFLPNICFFLQHFIIIFQAVQIFFFLPSTLLG